ncbi:hypothetical protein PXH69_21805 [Rhodococcus qingshengii]|uniref:Uncharacterized protein n=1 Tax=Rhodococcus qingshengii TaxID=334542 RepID=A0AAW6LKV6_RHOSG|nr:hypothetical protein [Rhodococcus qingshengii]MDE8647614.1 hypothetical protein [Rhodococcus qingshengii]
MAHNFFDDQNFARIAAEQAAKIDTNGIRDAVLQNVTPYDTNAAEQAMQQSISAFNTVDLIKWQSPAHNVLAGITEQLTAPAFDQMQIALRDLNGPWLDSVSAALDPIGDAEWLKPYLQSVDTVTVLDTVYSAQSPIVEMVAQMNDTVRDQFFLSPTMTESMISSQFASMVDAIGDLVTPALIGQFRDSVIAPNVASVLDNIAESADDDLIEKIEGFLANVSDEQEAFVENLIDANPTLKVKFQGAIASLAGKIATTVDERQLGAGLLMFAVTAVVHTVLMVAPEEAREQTMQFVTIAAFVYGVYFFHSKK